MTEPALASIDALANPGLATPVYVVGQTLMNGMGVLHLEIKQYRLERDFNLKVRVGKPRVSYRETVKKAASSTLTASFPCGAVVR